MDFEILESASLAELSAKVSAKIAEGYLPSGSIFVLGWRGTPCKFFQSVIKRELLPAPVMNQMTEPITIRKILEPTRTEVINQQSVNFPSEITVKKITDPVKVSEIEKPTATYNVPKPK